MIQLEVLVSNEGARAARYEIRSFLEHATRKMAGELPDRRDTATPAYVILRTILAKLEGEIARQDKEEHERQRRLRPDPVPVRELRGFRRTAEE